jgi:hypothetical protein
MGSFPLFAWRRLEAQLKRRQQDRPDLAQQVGHCRIAATIAQRGELTVQAPPGELGNRRKPLTQISFERLQLRRPAMTLRTVLRSNPVRLAMAETPAPCRCRSRIMTISPSRVTRSPPSLRGKHRPQSADRSPRGRRRYVSPPGEFSIGTFGEFSSGADTGTVPVIIGIVPVAIYSG